MALTESQLLADAAEIKDEVIPNANSALRVGAMMENIIKSATKPYDPNATYSTGQYVFYNSASWRALASIAIGESPFLAPAKWKGQDRPTFDQLTEEAPLLASDYATANNPAITGLLAALTTPDGEIIRQMLPIEFLAYLLKEAADRLGFNEVAARNPVTNYPVFFGADANAIGKQDLRDPKPKGTVVLVRHLDGSERPSHSAIFTPEQTYALTLSEKLRLLIGEKAVDVFHELFRVSGDLVARSLSVSSIPIAERIDHVPVMVADGKGGATTKYLTPFEFARQIGLASSRPQPVARYIECYDEYDTQSGPMTISPAKIGQPQPHTLHLPASQIFGRISYPDGQPAGGYSLTYPSLDMFQVNDAGAGGGETSDLIVELTKRTS